MERQALSYPERRLPWVQVQLSLAVLALGGAHTEGIFRSAHTHTHTHMDLDLCRHTHCPRPPFAS